MEIDTQKILDNINDLSLDDINNIKDGIDDIILEKEIEKKKQINKTREEIIKEFNHYGYIVPSEAKLYKVFSPPNSKGGRGSYGMEVGNYTHSCHVDTSELKVLLVLDGDYHFVESYIDIWLKEVK